MKQFTKRVAALMMVLFILISLLPGTAFTASAASYVFNWGQRGTVATELSDMAEDWYEKYNVTYASLSALSGSSSTSSVPSSSLYTKLKTLMTSAHSYKTSYEATKDLYMYTDCQNGGGKISSFYSGTSIGPEWGEGGSWNREHTWPNSKGLNGSDENDIMMLRPTATSENNSRGNTAYGESGSYYDPNEESNGKYNLHGDVARICLYVYVRWGNTSYMWGQSGVMQSKEVLLKWMEEDPVDTWELGRNDAVQSITGTRNVFVDYPELAFDLFEEEVPDGYQSPSGTTSAYTITAYPNNTSYGTVSMSGKTITAYPYEGYQVSGYKVISGTATVTRSENVFTVSASSDCSIQILFAPRVQASVTFMDQGTIQSSQTVYSGDVIKLPAYSGSAPDNYTFCGWVTQQIEETDSKPEIYTAGSNYTVSAAITLHALFARVEEGMSAEPVYMLVTNASQLSEGASVVIAVAGTTALAMKSTGGTNNRYTGSITKNTDNTISFDASIDILTLGSGTVAGTYSFFSEANGQYLAAGTSSGSNILKLQNSVDAAASFAVTVNSDGTVTAISQTSSDRNSLRYNSSANVFACYATGQKAISLYVSTGGGVLYYTTDPVSCEHTNTSTVAAVEATCTESGFTAGVQCDDCGRIISGHEVVNALGHNWGNWTQTVAPGCETAGEEIRGCGICDEEETRSVAAKGHSYVAVVTPPTVTEQGYTTYTCSVCRDSYVSDYTDALGETYTVSFAVPVNVAPVADMSCGKAGIALPKAGDPKGDHAYSFVGWLATTLDNSEEEPEFYGAGETFYAAANTTLYALYTYTVGGTGNTEYTLTDISDITATDSVVITMTSDNGTVYALDNDNGTSAAPEGVTISVSDGKLSAEPAENLLWNIGGTADAYVFYPNGSTTTWLYCTSTNNGVRVGTNTANKFSIDASTGYLKHTGTGRYVGVYKDKPDWRCYTSTSVNIGGQTLGFYVKGEAGTTYYTTVITNSCSHESYENGVCTNCGTPEPVQVTGMDMLLSDDLKVNFYLNVKSAVTVTVGDDVYTYTAEELKATDDGLYVATVSVAAAQMTDEITVLVEGCDEAKTYTVRQYADKLLADEAYAEYHALVKEMLNYGGHAQVYFGHNTTDLANQNITGVGAEAVPETTKELSVSGAA